MFVLIEVAEKWKKYFEKRGVLIDVDRSLSLLKETRKELRKLKKSGKVDPTLRYRVSALESLVMSSEVYVNGDYLDIVSLLREHVGERLRVFPKYNLTDTYRMYTNSPCIGNLDNVLKGVIVPDRGNYFVSIDFKHQEPWIIVNLLESDELKEILNRYEDFYMGILSEFGVDQTKENRDIVKVVWNSSIYGSSLDSLRNSDLDWVSDIYHWINRIPEVTSLRRKVDRNLRRGKPMYTNFGFERLIDPNQKGSVRQAFNSIFQMSGSGVLYTGLETFNNAIENVGLEELVRVHLTNHDEYLFEVSESVGVDEISKFLSNLNFEIPGWTLPRYSLSIGDSWNI